LSPLVRTLLSWTAPNSSSSRSGFHSHAPSPFGTASAVPTIATVVTVLRLSLASIASSVEPKTGVFSTAQSEISRSQSSMLTTPAPIKGTQVPRLVRAFIVACFHRAPLGQ